NVELRSGTYTFTFEPTWLERWSWGLGLLGLVLATLLLFDRSRVGAPVARLLDAVLGRLDALATTHRQLASVLALAVLLAGGVAVIVQGRWTPPIPIDPEASEDGHRVVFDLTDQLHLTTIRAVDEAPCTPTKDVVRCGKQRTLV